jgi:amino acid permease
VRLYVSTSPISPNLQVLGAGILAIPHTYNLAGVVNASVSLLIVAVINVFSIWMM